MSGTTHKITVHNRAVRQLPLGLGAVLLGLCLSALTAPGYAQSGAPQQAISLMAQPLSSALRDLGRQFSVQIVYLPATVAGRQSPALSGQFTLDQALSRLLAGTGIQVRRSGSNVSLSLADSGDATPLEPVRVHASRYDVTSEGSGSYAAAGATIGKSPLSLREIPQSVSVMTRTQMDEQGFTRVADAINHTTGISSSGFPDTESFNSRGFAASLQYDGVPAQEGGAPHLDLAVYDRIEVLRGPAGLLSGTAEPGGVVNLVRKRPTRELRFEGQVSAGSWNNYRAEADLSGPLNKDGSLRGRVVTAYQDKDQYYHQGSSKPATLYGVLEYDLTPATTLGVTAFYSELDFRNFNGLAQFEDGSLPDRRSFLGPARTSNHEVYELGADLQHRFDNEWVFKASYSHKESTYKGFSSFALQPISLQTGLTTMQAGRIHNEFTWDQGDVSVTGPFNLFGREHALTLGFNAARNNTKTSSRFSQFPDWDVLNDFDYGPLLDQPILNQNQDIVTQSGIYASTRLKLHDRVTAVLGGRWSNYESKSRSVRPETSPWNVSDAKASGEFTPFAGLILDVNDTISLYSSYAESFVPQSQQDYTGKTLDPRKGWQIEAGAKGEFLDGRLNGSVAIYRMRDTNRAVTDTDHIGCGGSPTGTCSRAAGLVQSQGWEMELVGNLAPGWDLGAGYTYTDVRYRRDSVLENEGQRFNANLVPKHLFRLWTHYRFQPQDWDGRLNGWSVGAGVQAQSNLFTSDVYQGGYATVSAKIGYKPNDRWEASLAVNNVFDRRYLSSVGYSTFLNIYGAPRNAMLNLKYRY
ncbi:TonB-dependent siderophore receptor [Alcaligenes faecalis]|uniref:TonB-dependent siderophore receptor n=1 Tax=Alcaligenes faecalis TaxID=511 RepID=UPI002932F08B|nr:TonB-dependent siderophore receptor [Alcaligenes faecalis]MDV2115768.1 TonB-dependent siderophore receptor [Alcaligenes faecalis]